MLSRLIVSASTKLPQALTQLDATGEGILLVLDSENKLVGVLTDGDVRRALIKRETLSSLVSEVMCRDYKSWPSSEPREAAVTYLRRIRQRHLPVIDSDRKLVDIILLDDLEFGTLDHLMVFMAGGIGSRLEPLTKETPKPMLLVGGKPLLEGVLENQIKHGFRRFCFCVNYLAHQIEDYFGDGSKWGVSISYIREPKRLGTAGGLSLLIETSNLPIIVMNGDLLTNLDFGMLLAYHRERRSLATMCVRNYKFQIPYGVVETDGTRITRLFEKPSHQVLINAGVYVIERECVSRIPKGEYFDMPQLFEKILAEGLVSSFFPIDEYWLDIGHIDDYKTAQALYQVIGR